MRPTAGSAVPWGAGPEQRCLRPLFACLATVIALAGCTAGTDGSEPATGTESADAVTGVPTPTSPDSSATPAPESLSFSGGDVTLAADLRRPLTEAPYPGVVLLHGSGPQSRDHEVSGQVGMGFGFSVPLFAQLAEALQQAGYAVLTYDKRSCGPFNGCADNDYPQPPDDLTITVFLDDAEAALTALSEQPGVDPERLAVVGLSQGATLVAHLLGSDAPVAGSPSPAAGVMLAPPHDPIDAVIADQAALVTDLLQQLGATEDQIRQSTAGLQALVEDLETIRDGDLEGPPVQGASRRFWASWIDLSDRTPEVASSLDQPLLLLGGEVDWNVRPAQLDAWRETLMAKANAEVVVLPCVTHALTCTEETDPAAMTPDDLGRTVHDEVIATVVSFLDEHLDTA